MFDFTPLDTLLKLGLVALVISVPLAIWKVIDIVAWLVNNVTISV